MRFLIVLFMLGILTSFLQAQDVAKENTFSLVNVLPERTLIVAGVPDVISAKKAFTETNLYKLFMDPEVSRFFKPFAPIVEPEIEKGLKEFQKNLGITLEETLAIASGEIFLSIVDIFPQERMPLGAVLSLEFGDQQKGIMHFLSMIEKQGRIKFTEQKFEGFSIYETEKAPVCYAIIANTFILSSKRELLEELLLGYMGKPKEKLLKDNPGVRKVAVWCWVLE